MTNEQEKIVEQEISKRKELSRVRIFWLLVAVNIALVIYIIVQILLLAQK